MTDDPARSQADELRAAMWKEATEVIIDATYSGRAHQATFSGVAEPRVPECIVATPDDAATLPRVIITLAIFK